MTDSKQENRKNRKNQTCFSALATANCSFWDYSLWNVSGCVASPCAISHHTDNSVVEWYFRWTLRILQATAYLIVILLLVDGNPKTFHTFRPKLAEAAISTGGLVSLYYHSKLLSSCYLEWQNFIVHSQAGHAMFPQAGREQKQEARETQTKHKHTQAQMPILAFKY